MSPDSPDTPAEGVTTQDPSHEVVEARSDQHALEVVEVREGAFGAHGTGDTSGFGGLTRPVVMPGAASRPFGGWYDQVADDLATLALDMLVDEAGFHRAGRNLFLFLP